MRRPGWSGLLVSPGGGDDRGVVKPWVHVAADIYRGLADPETGNPAAYLPGLAMSLWAVGWVCDHTGQQVEAGLAAMAESVVLHERLAAAGDEPCRQRLPSVRATRESLLRAADPAGSV